MRSGFPSINPPPQEEGADKKRKKTRPRKVYGQLISFLLHEGAVEQDPILSSRAVEQDPIPSSRAVEQDPILSRA
eukprot:CAMPEP_0113893412 /NCGR_PEP_ID=MMETSP0780_2-20120614/16068_1 /TAXON_ID=652834 /ORGANISM="Palpitomonas bilix" /LENGTH=74 /DNA_ID=CAMNT_0000883679 /DNA_START=470 /DNA_END=694 /DNA_ORIENTATION=- /assembly_acc=CAM_ASM_000599